jgi:hypothetical protein
MVAGAATVNTCSLETTEMKCKVLIKSPCSIFVKCASKFCSVQAVRMSNASGMHYAAVRRCQMIKEVPNVTYVSRPAFEMSRVWMAIQVAISAPSCIEILSPATPRLRVVLFTLRMAKMASSFVPQSRQSRPSLVNARHPEPREAGNQVSSW